MLWNHLEGHLACFNLDYTVKSYKSDTQKSAYSSTLNQDIKILAMQQQNLQPKPINEYITALILPWI